MLSKKNAPIIINTRVDTQSLDECAKELALCRTLRGRKCESGILSLQLSWAKRQSAYALKRFSYAAENSRSVPVCVEKLSEGHYMVEKCLASFSVKQLAAEKYTVICDGFAKGQIRSLTIAKTLLENKGYKIDMQSLRSFLEAFQQVSPLDESELLSLITFLRLLCARRAAQLYAQVNSMLDEYMRADMLFKKLKAATSESRKADIINDAARSFSCAGVTRLYTLMCDTDSFSLISQLKKCLERYGRDIFDEAEKDRQKGLLAGEGAVNITSSLQFAGLINTEEFLNEFSLLRKELMQDSLYPICDEPTKAGLSHKCCLIAAKLKVSQAAVARAALRLGLKNGKDVSFYLCKDIGKKELFAELGGEYKMATQSQKLCRFLLPQLGVTVFVCALCATSGILPALLAFFPTLAIANALSVRFFCKVAQPKLVPALDIEKCEYPSTALAVCCLITDEGSIESVMSRLETHYLANPLKNCIFCVLGDFKDSKVQEPTDEENRLLSLACQSISNLNKKYAKGSDIFFILHRHRTLCKTDGIYMGRERKRGSVNEFFEYLVADDKQRKELEDEFLLISGKVPHGIKYCTVLDSDTILPRGTLARLTGCMIHPQNRAKVEGGKVVSGIGILAPRIEQTAGAPTEFARIKNGFCGTVPYNTPVCDFYNDIFDEAVFGGKGIIDIEAFLECTQGRIYPGTVLSHDMLESCFVRAAHASDIVLYDTEPKTLISWWKRQHRWIRGDWQLLPYLFAKRDSKRHISPLSKLKVYDNLRRSLTEYMIFGALWNAVFFGFGIYAWIALACAFFEPIAYFISSLVSYIRNGSFNKKELVGSFNRSFMDFMAIPYAATKTFDAVFRTLYRLIFSHKKMLEWQTAAQGDAAKTGGVLSYYKKMWLAPLSGVRFLLYPLLSLHGSLILGVLFIYAPFALYLTDRQYEKEQISGEATLLFTKLFSDIWQFFEYETNESMGFIAPDNVQSSPYAPPVYNTSPTNIGMSVMATCCAHDAKLIDDNELVFRLEVSCSFIEGLEKWNGHLYNWYNIKTKEKLTPAYVSTVDSGNLCACLIYCGQKLSELNTERAKTCAKRYMALANEPDFMQLYDSSQNLFYIGFDVSGGSITKSRYDLLASEARLTYLVACALNKVPQKGWYSLGRVLVRAGDSRALISWSGTMFEYLMPQIFTTLVKETLFDETCKAAIDIQIRTAAEKKLPWGVSESGYAAFDPRMYYQYKAFGENALGLAPVYLNEYVVAPYATILAAMIYPEKAYANLVALEKLGARGNYGFYEAVDFTPGRVIKESGFEIVKSFMAHHQGMSICSLTNVLFDNAICKRFERIPEIKTVSLLFAEKLPQSAVTLKKYERPVICDDDAITHRRIKPFVRTRAMRHPYGAFLTGSGLCAFLTDADISCISYEDICVTRFCKDAARGFGGLHIYVACEGRVYSLTGGKSDECSMNFSFDLHKAISNIKTSTLNIKCESIAMQGSPALCTKIIVHNTGSETAAFELGAFAEIALARYNEYAAHPAFVNLGVDAKVVDNILLLCRRSNGKKPAIYAFSAFSGGKTRYITNGLICPGRHGSFYDAMKNSGFGETNVESPTQPVMSAKSSFSAGAGERVEIMFTMGAAKTEELAIEYAKAALECGFENEASLSFAMEMSALHFMRLSQGKTQLFNRILTRIMINSHQKPSVVPPNLPFSTLYRFSVSEDVPYMVARIKSPTQFRLLKTLLQLSRYAKHKGVHFQLVIIGDYELSYRCDVKNYITELASAFSPTFLQGDSKSIKIIDGFDISEEENSLLLSCASIVIDTSRSLDRQFTETELPATVKLSEYKSNILYKTALPGKLICPCEFGGFSNDTGEYVIRLLKNENTPLPWSNILCCPGSEHIGALITESGGGYTWKGNCHSGRITPWFNDALHDPMGDMLFISDENGAVCTVCHSKMQGEGYVTVRHGFGYTSFENENAPAHAKLTVFCDISAPQKISRLELYNRSKSNIKLFVTYAADFEKRPGAYTYFTGNIAFCKSVLPESSYIAVKNADSVMFSNDREAFFGMFAKNENCASQSFAALRCEVNLMPNEKRELLFMLGMAKPETAQDFVAAVNVQTAEEKLFKIKSAWNKKTGALSVITPDESFNTLVNKRLLYQVYASRLIARTGFYQSGGAFGFRDQLQDCLSLLYTDPERAKGQIILCASMQFKAGDCLHWWHMPSSGVRTKITDDRLFLPFVCSLYAKVVGDSSVFNISVPYLKDVPIPEGAEDIYFSAEHSNEEEPIYNHCLRAIESLLNYGKHDLLLMGGGDWNDGFNAIGKDGGESVFLSFMMITVAKLMLPTARQRNDEKTVKLLMQTKERLEKAINESAWGGAWFKRAFFGDGYPLGAEENEECRIDLVSQVWATFAQAEPKKVKAAMESAAKLLCDRQAGCIKLLTPPFSGKNSTHYAGYIESYISGVRENGAQYTHAAAWYVIALCLLGDAKAAQEAFSLLNPVNRSGDINRYKAEPYVVAADIYSAPTCAGQGGWTWYTGSASWLYIAAVRYIAGVKKTGNVLKIEPCNTWQSYGVCYRFKSSVYNILVERVGTESFITCDGKRVTDIVLQDDGKVHEVYVRLPLA